MRQWERLPSQTVSPARPSRTARPSLDSLLADCDRWRLTVALAALPRTVRGAYHHATRTIVLRAGMPEWMAVPTLMHEMEHARRGDEGPQPRSVEARIDAVVARRLVTVEDYAAAELLVGCRVGALAAELEVPTWVIEAWQRTLRAAGPGAPGTWERVRERGWHRAR